MWRSLLCLICIITNSLAQNKPGVLPAHYSLVVKFDLIVDEDVDIQDPRIKSIIYSAKSYQQSRVMINYVNPNAQRLATKLAQIFVQQNLSVIRPKQVQLSGTDEKKVVQVNIYYQE